MRVGFVGIGMMGLPMLENLARTEGFEVWAFDRAQEPLQRLAQHPSWNRSLFAAGSINELRTCSVVVTMLPDSSITNAILLGGKDEPGLIDILTKGTLVIDMGSSNPLDTQMLAEKLDKAGLGLVDAPVSGAVAKARTGSLSILFGGTEAQFAVAQPILEAMGSTIIKTGRTGSAHAMKALNNYVYASGLLAVSEALAMVRALDLDASVLADVLSASSGRNVASETKLKQFLIPETFAGGFALKLMAKDLGIAGSLQRETGLRTPQLELCTTLWQEALAVLEPGADNTEIYRHIARQPAPAATKEV